MANMNSIGDYIRQQREQAKISLRQLADQAGVSNPYLSQIERGLRKPSADILQQIAKGLRISAEALYVQAGILEDHPGDSGVRSALLTDPQLTERQKQVLIEIYESFRKESQQSPTAEVVAVTSSRPRPGGEVPSTAAAAQGDSAQGDSAQGDSAQGDSGQADTGVADAGLGDAGKADDAPAESAPQDGGPGQPSTVWGDPAQADTGLTDPWQDATKDEGTGQTGAGSPA
jgi:transcriptional regulator with XRE-family HTH domain